MASAPDDGRLVHFSTAHLPERDRVSVWREELARQVLRVDLEPLTDVPFHADVKMRALPGLGTFSAAFCGTRERRTRALVADGNDMVALLVNLSGPFIVSARGEDVTLGNGDGFFLSSAEIGSFIRPSMGRMVGVAMPRAALAPFVPNIDDAAMRMIPPDTVALKLLTNYIGGLEDVNALTTPELRGAVATHLSDLFALAVGAIGDVAGLAASRGGRAARLRAIKVDIAANLGRQDLGVAAVALRHGITPRHIHRLFETEGATFSEFVLDIRLAHAHRMLSDPKFIVTTIGAIASAVGFADRSYFNRAFRRRYGSSPSDLRAATGRGDEC